MIEQVNKCIITLSELDTFVTVWRRCIIDYKVFTLYDLKFVLNFDLDFNYVDICYGYTKMPSPEYFEIVESEYSHAFMVVLKLPEPECLKGES